MTAAEADQDTFDSERRLASAVQFLIDGGDDSAANLLLSCSLDLWESGDSWWVGEERHYALHVTLTGPRMAYDTLTRDTEAGRAIRRAIEAMIPTETYIKHFEVKAALIDIDPDWRVELLEIARGRGVNNQAERAAGTRTWQRLNFRSESEVRIAEALERARVMFLPNSRARVGGSPKERRTREPDFLVCVNGSWGVLEVDGEPFHPPTRTVEDDARDRLFRSHGVAVVEHFDATRRYQDPDGVVVEFSAAPEPPPMSGTSPWYRMWTLDCIESKVGRC